MRHLARLTLILALAGCQQTLHLYETTHDAAVSATGGQSGKGGTGGNPFDGGSYDGHCNGAGTALTVTPDSPKMAIVLDRSTSMNQSFNGSQSQSQLIAALTALDAQVGAYQPPRPTISFFFVDFPSEDPSACAGQSSCCASSVRTDWAMFKQKVSLCATSSSCASSDNRPTKDALATAETALMNAGGQVGQRYILLITDGEPGGQCATPDDCDAFISEIGTLTDARLSIITLPNDPRNLDCFNYATFTPPQPVSDATGLAGAVSAFMQSAACNATLSPAPPPGADLHVTFGPDNAPINPDRANGWSYDGSGRFRLRGTACSNQVAQSGWSTLKVSLGCGSGH